MADTKITALTAITTVDPAVDVLPIVDVSDTTMAASGTTKKITSNQILGAGGTATLASATITGDLTVDTSTLKVDSANNRVGIGTVTPDATLDVTSAGTASTYTVSAVIQDGTYPASGYPTLEFNGFIGGNGYRSGIGSIGGQQLAFYTPSTFGVAPTERYRIASDGVATWSNVGGVAGTAMTLNATGLGVKGTIGTSSGDAVIAFGTRGVIAGNAGSAIASGSYIDIAVITNGAGYQGFLSVANTLDANANARTQTTFSVFGRGASSTITQIATADGPTSGASFTVTTPSAGVIRITNTAGSNSTIAVQFFGATSG